MRRLTICIPTYKRNAELAMLLAEIQGQSPPRPPRDVSILVIDNNPGGDAASVIEAADQSPFPVHYLQEKRPGVAYVRNAALDHCFDHDDLVFIDDDTLPAAEWLNALCDAQHTMDAGVVFGSVEARYLGAVPEWIQKGDFHSKRIIEDGPRHLPGATDNCIIDMAVIREHRPRFDEGLSLIGGEDTLFFDGLLRAGVKMADASQALTFETIPENRATAQWLCKRWKRTGYTDSLMFKRQGARFPKLQAAVKGILRLSVAGPMALFMRALSRGRMTAAEGNWRYTFERGRGMLSFASGRSIQEYARET
ncbi:MAG: glycosyltransferase [Pseudomonadota bacterium]